MGTTGKTGSHLRADAQRAYTLGVLGWPLHPTAPSWPARVGIGRLYFWDVARGRCLHTLEGHTDHVFTMRLES